MKDGGDVFGVFAWGLRKYALLVLACVIAFGLIVPGVLNRVPDQFEAQAQVGPAEQLNLQNLDALPRLGESVFNNGVVAEAIRQSFDPPLPRSVSVVPDRVELVAAQDNIVYLVLGRGATPASAERVANIAAAQFTQELNKYALSVGAFAIQRVATPPTEPVPKIGGVTSIGIGILSGLVVGVGLVSLLLVWRRPVLDAVGAEATAGVSVFGRVMLTISRGGTRGLPQLSRRVMSSETGMLLLAGPRNTRRERRMLVSELAEVLGWSQNVVEAEDQHGVNRSTSRAMSGNDPTRPDFVIINGPTQIEVATRPEGSLTLLVVREGIAHSSLRSQAEQYLDDGAAGVVLVHGSRLHPRWWFRPLHRREASKSKTRTLRVLGRTP